MRHIVDDTLLQFGRALGSGPRASAGGSPREARVATVCPKCAQHFSPDGRFCPFDGEPLRAAPEWDPSLDPLLGALVDGRYEIRSVLGEGGMGTVYEARHCVLGKRFALKALRKDLSKDADIAARFTQEARTAAAVSHPGLVEITDFGQLPTGQPFFVMELLEGQSLAALIRRGGPIPAARAVDIVRQIADALGAAHEHSIVHRDLKPDNIYISSAGPDRDRVTIVDFGLAKVIGTSRLTRAGLVFGTPHYMSPEQAMGEATDHRADVYSLGIVMYEMFTGRLPFEADSYMGVLTKHMYMAPTPPSQILATTELGVLEDITLRCLEKKPEHRYATLRELSHDLDAALDASNGERLSASRQRRAVPRSVLADELELPSREERALRARGGSESRRAARIRRYGLLFVAIGSLLLAGIAGTLTLRTSATAPPGSAHGYGSPGTVQTTTNGGHVPAVTAPLPIMSLPALPATNTEASARPTKHKPLVIAAPHAAGAPPAPAAVTPKKTARVEASDIVDPWAK